MKIGKRSAHNKIKYDMRHIVKVKKRSSGGVEMLGFTDLSVPHENLTPQVLLLL